MQYKFSDGDIVDAPGGHRVAVVVDLSGADERVHRLEQGLPGLARDLDIRTDVPRYRVWRDGVLVDEPTDISSVWRDDLVTFAIGCSFSFEEALVAEIRHFCPSLLEEDGDTLVIRHLYIERRMIPLNIYIQEGAPEQVAHAVIEYGNAIKDLVAANIFPGDMLWKNFGVMRHGKVVFYDYDEIEYITDCNFRRVPEPRNEEEEMSGEIWYHVGPKDVFPETFAPFLLGNLQVRDVFMKHHADLLDPAFWQQHKERILAGHVHDVFPYDVAKRFKNQRPAPVAAPA